MSEGPFDRPVTFAQVAARIEATTLGETAAAMRANFARLLLGEGGAGPPSDTAEALTIRPRGHEAAADDGPCLVWFHGGGYVFGAPETHRRAALALAAESGWPVVLPRYRLAPDHGWPSQLADALKAIGAIQRQGRPVVLVGDSAGGHLALTAALALARDRRPAAGLVLFSPNTDRTGLSRTRVANTPRDPMNADEDDTALARLAFGGRPPDDPQVSPLLDDLALLPPTLIEVGGREVLFDDARLLAERGRLAGAAITLHVEPHAFHLWQLWTPWLPEATASLARAAAHVRALLDPPS